MRSAKAQNGAEVHTLPHARVGIVVSRYHRDITDSLLNGALAVLRAWKVPQKRVDVLSVPGSFEIPYGCLALIKKRKPDAVIALGCVIKGETEHDRYIAHAVSESIMRLSLLHELPIGFGVLTTRNRAQALARARGKANKGAEAAQTALALLRAGKRARPRR